MAKKQTEFLHTLKEFKVGDFLKKDIKDVKKQEEKALRERRENKKEKEEEMIAQAKLAQVQYSSNLKSNKKSLKAYIVFLSQNHNETFVGFGETMGKAVYQVAKKLTEEFYFGTFKLTNEHKLLKGRRLQQLDSYADEGKAPIPELLKAGITLRCAHCHKRAFTYSDYIEGRCFVYEGEWDMNFFTKGFVLCYDCKRKLNMD